MTAADLYVAAMEIEERNRQVGRSCVIEEMFTRFVNAMPRPIPAREEVVN